MSNAPSPEIISGVSLVQALDDATRHLLVGMREISSEDWYVDIGQVGFELLATGVEKLCKLTLMVEGEVSTGSWLSDSDLREMKHDVADLVRVTAEVIDGFTANGNDPYLAELQAAVRDDAVWAHLVRLLNTAASAGVGRYRHAKSMGGCLQDNDSPAHQWDALVKTAATHLGILDDLHDPAWSAVATAQVKVRVLDALVRWWYLIYRVWQHGAVGPNGRRAAGEIAQDLQRLPAAWDDVVTNL